MVCCVVGWIAGWGEWGGLRSGVGGVCCVVGWVAGWVNGAGCVVGWVGWVAWWVGLQDGVNGVGYRMG